MKLWNYVVIFTGLVVLLKMGGIAIAGVDNLLNLIKLTLNSTGIASFELTTSSFWDKILGTNGILTTIGTLGVIAIGTFIYSKDKSFLVLSYLTGTIYIYGSLLVAIINYGLNYESWAASIIGLIFIPLSVGFFQSLVDYFEGVE